MTIQFLAANIISGLSTDTKPVTVPTDSRFIETDTQRWFIFDGTDWTTEIGVPIAADTFYISSEAQLEETLGSNLEVPDGTSVLIVLLNDVTFTKPIKVGVNSTLILTGDISLQTLVYVGAGAFIQPITPGGVIGNIILENLIIAGTSTQTLIDVDSTVANFFFIVNSVVVAFATLGRISNAFLSINTAQFLEYTQGFLLEDPVGVSINDITFSTSSAVGSTVLTMKGTALLSATITKIDGIIPAGNSMFFIDPALASDSRIKVSGVTAPGGQLFQSGVDIEITGVSDDGGGFAKFTTASSHGLIVGQAVVLKNFVTQTQYNQTAIVMAVDTPITGTTFDTDIAFVADDTTGDMNKASLDSTDIRVLATDNPNEGDSMFIGESGLEVFGSEIEITSLAQDAFSLIPSASWAYSNLERFSEGAANGQLISNDTATRKYRIAYSGTIEKRGGGTVDIGIVILVNGANVAFNPPHTVNSGQIQITGNDLIELAENDTIDIAVINYDATSATIDVSQLQLTLAKA